MVTHGEPPYLECSSLGDKRFSAFFAYVNGISIEEQYQSAKEFDRPVLHWRHAKGKKANNQEYVTALYAMLWNVYIEQNPHLLEVLKAASGLSDEFGQEGHCCQATELWRIRNGE
jgi:hypothetical protein